MNRYVEHLAKLRRIQARQREASRPGLRPTLETIKTQPEVAEVVTVPEGLAVRSQADTSPKVMRRVGSIAIRVKG